MNNQTEGERLRDEGHEKVILHNHLWHKRAMNILRIAKPFDWTRGEVTSEDIRRALKPAIGLPSHPNAWGALIRAAARKGIIEDTGRSVKASNASAHARRLPVWRFK